MAKQRLESKQEKAKEKIEEKARKKKEESAGVVEEKPKPKPKPKKKTEIKKPVVTEAIGRAELLPISPKISVEVCRAIKGKTIKKANKVLDGAISIEAPILYKRFNKDTPHRKGKGFGPGRYPMKVAFHIKDILTNAVANAQYLNLDTEKLYVKSAIANRAMSKESQRGRYSHISITVAERVEMAKPKASPKKAKAKVKV